MAEPSSLLGLPLAEARHRLEAAGTAYHVVESLAPVRPPRGDQPPPPPPTGEWRVARVRQVGPELELVAVLAPVLPSASS